MGHRLLLPVCESCLCERLDGLVKVYVGRQAAAKAYEAEVRPSLLLRYVQCERVSKQAKNSVG